MSMTDNFENPIPKPVRKHRKHRRRVAKKIGPFKPNTEPKTSAEFSEFSGMTAMECCDKCGKDFCEISEIPQCAHPFKGGLPPQLLGDMQAVKRYNRAKMKLKNQSIDPNRM
jgi:hypothetical protein